MVSMASKSFAFLTNVSSVLLFWSLLPIVVGQLTFETTQSDSSPTTLRHCGDDCTVQYTIAKVQWAPTTLTVLAYSGATGLALTRSRYNSEFGSGRPAWSIDGTFTDSREPAVTTNCCGDAWYITGGVTARYGAVATLSSNATACETVNAIFKGAAVGTAQASPPTRIPFLEHDCEVTTATVNSLVTKVAVIPASPNPSTAPDQSTWWDTNRVTIKVDKIFSTQYTLSPCPLAPNIYSCAYRLASELRYFTKTTITISGNAEELATQEASISSKIENWRDWTTAPDSSLGTMISLLSDVTVTYESGVCPDTVLTGWATLQPFEWATWWNPIDRNSCTDSGGGTATTKTAVYIAKIAAITDDNISSSLSPATRELNQLPSSTPRNAPPRPTSATTPTPRSPSEPTGQTQAQSPPPRNPIIQRPPTTIPKQETPADTNKAPAPIPQEAPNSPVSSQQTLIPDAIPGASAALRLLTPPASEPSKSIIIGPLLVFLPTTNADGVSSVITTVTGVPIATVMNIVTNDSNGDLITTQTTIFNPSATDLSQNPTDDTLSQTPQSPMDNAPDISEPENADSGPSKASSLGLGFTVVDATSSRAFLTTISTVTSRRSSSGAPESESSLAPSSSTEEETAAPPGDEEPGETGKSSSAVSKMGPSLGFLASLIVTAITVSF